MILSSMSAFVEHENFRTDALAAETLQCGNISVRFLLYLHSRDHREELALVVQTGEQEYVHRPRYLMSGRVQLRNCS